MSRIIFGRTFIVLLFIIIQLGVLFAVFKWLRDYSIFIYGLLVVLGGVVCIYIINRQEDPSFKLSWIIPILVFPVFGTLFYIFIQSDVSLRIFRNRANRLIEDSSRYLEQDPGVLKDLNDEDRDVAGLANYVKNKGGYPVYRYSEAEYFPSGQAQYERMKEELLKAEHYIFMEFFIVDFGDMLDTIMNILKKKADEGVEVFFMYDGSDSFALLPYNYYKKVEELGIRCHVFSQIRPALTTVQNNRDHRKIVLIDGKVAFTGGINLADEYINEKERFGYWKDVGIMVKGEAVRNFVIMFLDNWNIWEHEPISPDKYLPEAEEAKETNETEEVTASGYILPYGDSPLDHEAVGKQVYIDILYHAESYVHIMTPYLIIDDETLNALKYAAKRGIDVKIIMPHIPDKKYAFILAHTYYLELLEAGVRIYEFTPGFVHAKIFVSDDIKSVVGTINLDFRSMYHHFEDAVYLYDCDVVGDVESDFEDTLEKCQEITQEDCRKFPLLERFAGRAMRLIAPLM